MDFHGHTLVFDDVEVWLAVRGYKALHQRFTLSVGFEASRAHRLRQRLYALGTRRRKI